MDRDVIVEELNKIENKIDALRTKLLNEEREQKKKSKKTSSKAKETAVNITELEHTEYKSLASKYELPIDENFIQDVIKVVKWHSLDKEIVEKIFSNVKRANDKQPKDNIKNYTLGCLHRASKN